MTVASNDSRRVALAMMENVARIESGERSAMRGVVLPSLWFGSWVYVAAFASLMAVAVGSIGWYAAAFASVGVVVASVVLWIAYDPRPLIVEMEQEEIRPKKPEPATAIPISSGGKPAGELVMTDVITPLVLTSGVSMPVVAVSIFLSMRDGMTFKRAWFEKDDSPIPFLPQQYKMWIDPLIALGYITEKKIVTRKIEQLRKEYRDRGEIE